MRVAAIYDIHGNLPALEAVLDEIHQADVDCIVVGGDVVPGPMPGESLATLLDLPFPVHFIQGNGESDVLDMLEGGKAERVPGPFRKVMRWSGQVLPSEHSALMASWPQTLELKIPGLGEVLFCHATPRDDNEIFTRLTPQDHLLPIFDAVNADVVVCGHTHMQFDRSIGDIRVINAGSVGMPFGEPGAYWLLLGPNIELRKTSYDLDAAAERIRTTSYPQAEGFAAASVLNPPSEAQMLELFG